MFLNKLTETMKADPNLHVTDAQIEAYKKQSKKNMASRENAISEILAKTDELKNSFSNQIEAAKGKVENQTNVDSIEEGGLKVNDKDAKIQNRDNINFEAELSDHSDEGITYKSNDPLVGDLATSIEKAIPNKVVAVNKKNYRSDGSILTDLDIELKDIVIQVKSGGGKGLAKQLSVSAESTGKTVIGFAPDIKLSVRKEVERRGYQVFIDLESLLEFLKMK